MNRRIHRCFCFWVIGLIAIGCQLPLMAQEWAWAKRYGGQGAERSMGIALDPQGNVYAAGWFEGTAIFDSLRLTVTGQRDAFIGKWASNGNLLWVQKGGGKDEDYASAITVDPHGNPILLGTFRSATAEFGGMVVSNKYARDYNSLFIAKLDPSGKGTWVQQVGGASTGGAASEMASIKTDAYGNIYLVACMARFANFGVTNLSGYEDILVAKYDPNGNLAWARQAGGNGYDYGQSLAVTPEGVSYVTGIFEQTAPFDQLSLTSRGLTDIFLAKYTTDGHVDWVTQAGGNARDGNAVLAVDPEGGVVLSGYFTGSANVGTNLLASKASTYDPDTFLARFDGAGDVRWVQQIGNATLDPDTPGSVAVSVTSENLRRSTNVFLSGQFRASTTVGSVALTNSTAQRTFLSKWDMDGQSLWVRQAGGENTQIASPGIPDSSVYVTGQFSDPSAWNTTWLLSAGNSDLFLARLDPDAPTALPSKPVISEQPLGVSAARGSSVQLTVQIAGTSPVAYQWRKQGMALGNYNRVLGSTTARLSINTIQTNDAGNYTVVITNNYGSVTSAVAVVTVGPASPASGPPWSWVQTLGGSGSDLTSGLTADGSGNVYVTGTFQKTNVIGGTTLMAPPNAQNLFVAKYDSRGMPQWATQAGGTKYDVASGVANDGMGHLYLTGYFSSSNAAFGPYILTNQTPSYNDLFLAQLDDQGNFLWALSAGGTRDDVSRALTVDADGNVLIVGDFSSATLNFGGVVVTNVGGTDVFVAKFNPQGKPLWVRTAGSSGSHNGNAIAADASGNVYIAGEMWIRIRFGQTELDSHFDHDTFLAKYNSKGDLQWARQLNSFSIAIARNLAIDAQGNIIMSGYFDQSCDFDDFTQVSQGGQDVFLAKFNPSGNVLWARNFGGPGYENPRSLAVDATGTIYLTGSFEQTADFGSVTLTTSGQRDVFIVATDSSGQVIWAKQAGDTRSEDGYALAVGPANAVVVGGSFLSRILFDGVSYPGGSSGTDGFVAQLGTTPAVARVSARFLQAGIQLEISGPAGTTMVVEGASGFQSLIGWQPLFEVVLAGSPVLWSDPQAGLLNQKFYRLVIRP